ncbi:MAG: hypothetical protein OXN17_22415 [Candidatus Poribacteria bacterium]|nr:hypothetical protein [Candidatus Poribacteria bacterium]MDE0505292.1 hypothetical protein [Candidatus Poribacteria bacterium]
MRSKLTSRIILIAVLCVCVTSKELWLKNGYAVNTGPIVFTSFRDGDPEIYVMDADGGNQENLTNHPEYDYQPDWSPDGMKIAFVSSRDGAASQIHVMDADGKNVIRLTDGRWQKRDPDWSPDGGRIAFTVDEREDYIAVIDADGRNRKKLEDWARHPDWSPGGGQIAFVSGRDGGNEIYVIGVDGQGRKRVTHDLAPKRYPAFSPDGRRIAYEDGRDGLFFDINVVDADGRNLKKLEDKAMYPSWSPDGGVIAYYVLDGMPGNFRGTIHLMTSDGRHIRQLSHDRNALDLDPDISPLGLAVSPASRTSTTWGKLKKVELDRR